MKKVSEDLTTKERYLRMFRQKSVILNPDRKNADGRPICTRAIYGIGSLKSYYNDLLTRDTNEITGYPIGLLENARRKVRDLREEWKRSNPAWLGDKPQGAIAEKIEKAEALVLVLEEEARTITKILEQHEKEQRSQEQKKASAFKKRFQRQKQKRQQREAQGQAA